jgi:hypothetical protein
MVIEPAPIVPRDDDERRGPVGAIHDGIDLLDGPILAIAHALGGVLVARADEPGDRGQPARLDIFEEIGFRSEAYPQGRIVIDSMEGCRAQELHHAAC